MAIPAFQQEFHEVLFRRLYLRLSKPFDAAWNIGSLEGGKMTGEAGGAYNFFFFGLNPDASLSCHCCNLSLERDTVIGAQRGMMALAGYEEVWSDGRKCTCFFSCKIKPFLVAAVLISRCMPRRNG